MLNSIVKLDTTRMRTLFSILILNAVFFAMYQRIQSHFKASEIHRPPIEHLHCDLSEAICDPHNLVSNINHSLDRVRRVERTHNFRIGVELYTTNKTDVEVKRFPFIGDDYTAVRWYSTRSKDDSMMISISNKELSFHVTMVSKRELKKEDEGAALLRTARQIQHFGASSGIVDTFIDDLEFSSFEDHINDEDNIEFFRNILIILRTIVIIMFFFTNSIILVLEVIYFHFNQKIFSRKYYRINKQIKGINNSKHKEKFKSECCPICYDTFTTENFNTNNKKSSLLFNLMKMVINIDMPIISYCIEKILTWERISRIVLSCGHSLCVKCLYKCLEGTYEACPLCRKKIEVTEKN